MRAALAAALLATPLLLWGCLRGVGYEAEREGKYLPEPDPAQRVAEAVVICRKAGFPVVRMEVDAGTTRIRCATLSITVHQARIVK